MIDVHNLVDDPANKENVHAGGETFGNLKNKNEDVTPLQ